MNNRNKIIGKNVDHQAKQICYNVYSYYKKRKLDPSTIEYRDDVNLTHLVSEVTGLSNTTVTRIVRDANNMKYETGIVEFHPTEVTHVRKKRIKIDEATEAMIRKKVIQYYNTSSDVPSIRKLNGILKEEGIFRCSNEYLRLLLHKLGFTHSDGVKKSKLTVHPEIVATRIRYLKNIKQFRDQNKNIFFLSETKRWSLSTEDETKEIYLKEMPTLIALHVSGDAGFVDGKQIMTKMKTEASGKFEASGNFEAFENYEWVQETFLTNINDGAVVVTNIPYGDADEDDTPTTEATRNTLQDWLRRHNVQYRDIDSKADLIELIKSEKLKDGEYSIKKEIGENGHEVLHLPIHHSDLDPIRLAWEDIKKQLTKSSSNKEEITPNNLFSKYTKKKWQKCFDSVLQSEQVYYEHDMKVVKDGECKRKVPKREKLCEEDSDDGDETMSRETATTE